MNDFDDLDELERTLGPSLQVALRRAAGEITDERPPVGALDMEATELTALDASPSPDAQRRRRRRLGLAAAAAAILLVAGSILVRVATDDDSAGVVHVGPSPVPTTDPARPPSERPDPLPPAGAPPSTPETGTLLADLPNRPVFVYEDGRVIWPQSVPPHSDSADRRPAWNWFERQLTPEGLELVRAEIRSGGRLDPAAPPPNPSWRLYWDGVRELYTEGWAPEAADLSWIPAGAWADPEPRTFVSPRYAVCINGVLTDPSALLARLPADAAELLAGARQAVPPRPRAGVDTTCFELAIDDAREVQVAIDAAGAERLDDDFAYEIDVQGDPLRFVAIGFTPYLPHGNPVYAYDVP